MKYMRPYINFDSIKVTIKIRLRNGRKIESGYEFGEVGCAKLDMAEVFKMCPDLKNKTGQIIHNKILDNSIE